MPTATQSLRAATREVHSRLESTPFAAALLNKTLHRDAYAGFIRVLSMIQATLERQLDACDHPLVTRIWPQAGGRAEVGALRRASLLLEDNDFFRWELIPDAPAAMHAARQAASHVLYLSKSEPVGLLGCLYVLAGSTKGAVIMAPRVAQNLGLEAGQGLTYLDRHAGPGPGEWERAARALDAAATDPGQVQVMIQAAVKIFEHLVQAFEALWPLDREDMAFTVSALNPEAGTHPVPQDDRDQLAVLRTTERCLTEYPYFLYRYGLRGRRFSDADGAWLATLPELCSETLLDQVHWLAGVLASRGMPSLLLARHMEILADELLWARPEKAQRSSLLRQCAGVLRAPLDARLPRSVLQSRIAAMRQAVPGANDVHDFACAEAVHLLASAVADEARGLSGAESSLLDWLMDPRRFPETWTRAVRVAHDALREQWSAGGSGL